MSNQNQEPEIRLLPIHSCKECPHLGKEIHTTPSIYITFCGKTSEHFIIKADTKETPEHYKFPKFCTLQKEK